MASFQSPRLPNVMPSWMEDSANSIVSASLGLVCMGRRVLWGQLRRSRLDGKEPKHPPHRTERRFPCILQHETVVAAEPVRPGGCDAIDYFHAADDAADFEILALWKPLDAPLAADGQEVFVLDRKSTR